MNPIDYSTTVNLPKTEFPMKADLPKREPVMLASWEQEKVYEKALKRRESEKGKKQFILHDGPPYANGHLHLGHALNKILKDIIVRFKTMAGYYAPYVPGWDCHGLPIELQLMKELKVTDKHKVDRDQFRDQARAFAQKFVDIQRAEFKRMGVLGEWDKPYLTMDPEFKKQIVATFEELQKKGYVYRGLKPVLWCAIDETALAEAEVEYENDKGPSIFVAFPGHVNETQVKFVIWTTTPWTLPSNVAIAVNPDQTYGVFEEQGEKYVVATALIDALRKKTGWVLAGPQHGFQGRDLVSHGKARHPWLDRASKIIEAGFVAMDTGTGLVHIAPGHGRDDYAVGQQQTPPLPILSPVDDRGLFVEDFGDLRLKGQHVFKANPLIIEFLKGKGVLLHSEEMTHSYPHCWRCHKPVIFRATEQWFLNIEHERLRDRLLKSIGEVKWIPAYGQNRITGMVESRPDWCLSRQRLWGTEIPSQSPSSSSAVEKAPGDVKKDPDILDVWFESGVSWAAVLKQPSPWPELSYQADMYLEGSDQHRGWFQTSLIPSVALQDRAPYKSVLTHGFVMDGDGRPMSKSVGNVIAPEAIINQYGADVLRFWVAASDYGADVRVSQEILKGLSDGYRKVRNTFRYLLNNLSDFDAAKDAVPYKDLQDIDRWALHRLQEEIQEALNAYNDYQFHHVTGRLVNFCNGDLSSFYFDVIKDRLYCDPAASPQRRSAQTVLYQLAHSLFRLAAPILSFTADECWRFMGQKESVALADMPAADPALMDPKLAESWKILLTLRESVLGDIEKARAAGKVKAPREAAARLTLKKEDYDRLKPYEHQLSMILGISQVELSLASKPDGGGTEIDKAQGVKCARCWIYKKDVGMNPQWADVCGRCADVLAAPPMTGVLR